MPSSAACLKELRGLGKIRGNAVFFDGKKTEIVKRTWVILRGRLLEQRRRSRTILRHAFAVEFGESQSENRLAVPGGGRERIPAGGLGGVVPDAEPLRIKLTDEGHRRPVAGIGLDPLHRFPHRREIIAALIGRVGKVGRAEPRRSR